MADDIESVKVEERDDRPAQTEERDKELSTNRNIRDEALKIYKDIEKGFSDQWERSNSQMDYWDVYNCTLGPKQFYSGNSKIFVPIVHDAVNARKTRFVNQIFPQSGKHVEVQASEDKPTGIMSLIEFYIRKARLRTQVMPGLVRNGDIEGQYNIYLRWVRNERHVAQRVNRQRTVDDVEFDGDDYEDIEEQEIVHQYPVVEVLADSDVLVLPATADSIEGAIDMGGSVTVLRRWSKAKLAKMIRDGEITKDAGESLIAEMSSKQYADTPNKAKAVTDAAGIKSQDGKSFCLGYETWAKRKIDGEERICRIFFGGEKRVLGVKRNPYWCDKIPILSAPVEKIQGSFKGMAKVKFVESVQYAANDAINEGMDSAAYALLPIIMTDPEKNPRVGSMVLNVAAVWETSPKDTQFAQFPQLWKEAFQIVNAAKDQIFQTLGVNPAMMPQQSMATGKKPNQAQIANEQQVDILTTADAVTTLEGEILTPMLQWFVWLDHQFRDKDILVPAFGEMGVEAEMQRIEPVQMDRRFEFRWFGVEQARSQQAIQMKMAGINVLRQIPPDAIPGYKINIAPLIAEFVESTYGPRLAPRVFQNLREQLSLNPQFENEMLAGGFEVPVHPLDNDQEHMQAHMQAMQQNGDMSGAIREHLMRHQLNMSEKQKAQAAAAMQQQQGPPPQQRQQQQGRQPRAGGRATGPRPNGQGPAGMVHRDQIPQGMPRPRGML